MKELLEIMRVRRAHPDVPFALATVVRVEGSSYRKPGARMLVSLQGREAGSVSGGCLERDVISKGRATILESATQLLVYDTTDQDDMAFGSSLGCEGRIEILLQPLAPHLPWALADLADEVQRSNRAVLLATVYRADEAHFERLGGSFQADELPPEWQALLGPTLKSVEADKKPGSAHLAAAGADLLIERLAPSQHLVVFGGGHDVPPLVALARTVGCRVTVVDRRGDFAEAARFPGADAVLHLRPHEIETANLLSEDTAVVIMNHHYETDAELLGLLIDQPLLYLGMLGPRRRTVKILRAARAEGASFVAADLDKLHAPVGLDLGSDTPEQIALCILAEVQAVVMRRPAVHLRERSPLVEEVMAPCPQLAPA